MGNNSSDNLIIIRFDLIWFELTDEIKSMELFKSWFMIKIYFNLTKALIIYCKWNFVLCISLANY